MSTLTTLRRIALITAAMLLFAAAIGAHEMTIKGTVSAVESARIQVKTGEEKKGQAPTWYPIDAKTKIMRDKKVVTFDEAKIKAGERIVLIVNHDANGTMMALEIRLAAQ